MPTPRRLVATLLVGPLASAAPLVDGAAPAAPAAPAAAPSVRAEAAPADEAAAAAWRFLDTYVDPDGRVVRRDQGGDTVSEGQAYAMLIAAAIGDADTFDQIRRWTDDHLTTDDGLLAFRWADGDIVDPMPAADADLLAAMALSLGGERFGDDSMSEDAADLADAVLAAHSYELGGRPVLVAGPWAKPGRVINPSYFVFPAMSRLWADGDDRWRAIADSSRQLTAALTSTPPHLPPDWARLARDGASVEAEASPGGDSARYGFEAVRAIVQLAADCDPLGRQMAAQTWPFFATEAADDGTVEAAYLLDGAPATDYTHPVALVAAAAAADAAGDAEAAVDLLGAATTLDELHPTYYGAAWIALARLWLDTDLLGACGM